MWDISLLSRSDDVKLSYERGIASRFRVSRLSNESSSSKKWQALCAIACETALEVIKRPAYPRDPAIRNAFIELQRQLSLVNRLRVVDRDSSYQSDTDYPPLLLPGALANLIAARRAYNASLRSLKVRQLGDLLDTAELMVHVGDRTQVAMKFIRSVRQSKPANSQVTLRNWHQDLQKIQGDSVPLINEGDYFPLMRLPTHEDLEEVLARMKNGKAPGSDLMSAEMLKASPTLFTAVYALICEVYQSNDIPDAWRSTVSHPIPKKGNPKTIDDYRKITLCSLGYKIYISLIQQQLSVFLRRIPDYQSGFLPNRSCDDLIFILTRVMEERWNHNLPTFLMELDYRKAFDLVNIHRLPSILSSQGVPHYLINRIIKACLHESNCVSWMGEQTPSVNKSLGIKQGCPLSPLLFNLLLDCAVQRLCNSLLPFNIKLFIGEANEPLSLPMLLAYADDTSLLASELNIFTPILEAFVPILAEHGLGINVSKSGYLVKDPTGRVIVPPSLIVNVADPVTNQLSSLEFPQKNAVTVLGVAVNSHMERKSMIRTRCVSTVRIVKSLLPHLKKLRAPIAVLMRLYHVVIAPTILYGLKARSMTAANRRTLMNREVMILRDLSAVAYPKPDRMSFFNLLDGKTINRKVTVHRLRYYGHICRRKTDSLLQKAKNHKISLRRKVGRPLFTFNTTLLHDKQKFPEVTERQWEEMWGEYSQLKTITAGLYQFTELEEDDPLDSELMNYGSDEDDLNGL